MGKLSPLFEHAAACMQLKMMKAQHPESRDAALLFMTRPVQ